MIKPPSPLLSPADIEVGKEIPVYGRKFMIYDADEATKMFYKTFTGREVQPIPVPDEVKRHLQLRYPPHNGFGGEEDSLGSCLNLRPKAPPKDLVKLMQNSDRILRYEAVPENNVPEDAHRKFIIGIFMSDDTVAVWEVRQRNSGCVEGKFKERGVTINPTTGRPFQPNEFYVGARLVVSAMPFRIMRSDEYTLKYMESEPRIYPMSSIECVAEKLRGLEKHSNPDQLSPEAFRAHVGRTLGFELVDQEIITVLRNHSVPNTTMIDMPGLLKLVVSEDALDQLRRKDEPVQPYTAR